MFGTQWRNHKEQGEARRVAWACHTLRGDLHFDSDAGADPAFVSADWSKFRSDYFNNNNNTPQTCSLQCRPQTPWSGMFWPTSDVHLNGKRKQVALTAWWSRLSSGWDCRITRIHTATSVDAGRARRFRQIPATSHIWPKHFCFGWMFIAQSIRWKCPTIPTSEGQKKRGTIKWQKRETPNHKEKWPKRKGPCISCSYNLPNS